MTEPRNRRSARRERGACDCSSNASSGGSSNSIRLPLLLVLLGVGANGFQMAPSHIASPARATHMAERGGVLSRAAALGGAAGLSRGDPTAVRPGGEQRHSWSHGRLARRSRRTLSLRASQEENESGGSSSEVDEVITAKFNALMDDKSMASVPAAVKMLQSGVSDKIGLTKERGLTLLERVAQDMVAKEMAPDNSFNNAAGAGVNQADEETLDAIYDEMSNRGFLRAYGSIGLDLLPEDRRDISPSLLEELTGMEMNALTPGNKENMWLYAGVALCLAEFVGASLAGIDPMQTVIPWTAGLFVADRLLLKGAAFETLAQKVMPEYRRKIIVHEAGHFLLAYLMGCPVQGCVVNPWVWKQAKNGAVGQGGTVFSDPMFAKQMMTGSIKRGTIDRFSIILMAGIAAEAGTYGKAEGGMADEAALISILSTIAPPFGFEEIRKQARWSAVQATLLIKEHQAAFDALVAALEKESDLSTCIAALEGALEGQPLPSEGRQVAEHLSGKMGGGKGAKGMKGMKKKLSPSLMVRRLMEEQLMLSDRGTDLATEKKRAADAVLDFTRKLKALEMDVALGADVPNPSSSSSSSSSSSTGSGSSSSSSGGAGGPAGGGEAQAPSLGAGDDGGGVWLKDLSAIRERMVELDVEPPSSLSQLGESLPFGVDLMQQENGEAKEKDESGAGGAVAAQGGGEAVAVTEAVVGAEEEGKDEEKAAELELAASVPERQRVNAEKLAEVEARLRDLKA